jgi:hypothetical protein
MSSYANFEVKFVTRRANLIVHTLVMVTNVWASFYRFEIIILCIEYLLINDIN